jgi:hypothetical protein
MRKERNENKWGSTRVRAGFGLFLVQKSGAVASRASKELSFVVDELAFPLSFSKGMKAK